MSVSTNEALEFVKELGAISAGVATIDTLAGGPPSADLTYVLPKARSAAVFAFPLDQDAVLAFLSKKDRRRHERDNVAANTMASGAALALAEHMRQRGEPSVPVASNNVYRPESPMGLFDMHPNISLRYLAVRSGLGWLGLSGNLLDPERGAGVILGAAVTEAELEPTPPLPPEDNYCDRCKLCLTSCVSGMMHKTETARVTLGGMEFTYAKRRNYLRCEFVCGGFSGLHPSGRWSTWSPGRFDIPEDDEAFIASVVPGLKAYGRRPPLAGGFKHILMKKGNLALTCGNCQILCTPDKKERQRRFGLLTSSGAVVQNPDGSLDVVSPEEAAARVAAMDDEARSMYVSKP